MSPKSLALISSPLPVLLIGLSACSPTVNIATPEPVKVDVSVRVDVYQKESAAKTQAEESSLEVASHRRERMGEVQGLKNDRVVGENRDGFLEMRNPPKDSTYLTYAKGVIQGENGDRSTLYLSNAQSQNKPLEEVEKEYAQLWRDRAYPGEWVQKDDGTWVQK